MYRYSGFTLWELLWSLVVIATLITWGTPHFQTFVLNAKQTGNINAFVTAIQLARSEMAKRARDVVLCKTDDGSTCGAGDLRFDAGWMVFVNEDGVWPPQRSAAEPLLYTHSPEAGAIITANRQRFVFRPFRRRSTNGTVTFCDRRGDSAARAIIVSYTGRPRVASTGAGDRSLSCADSP